MITRDVTFNRNASNHFGSGFLLPLTTGHVAIGAPDTRLPETGIPYGAVFAMNGVTGRQLGFGELLSPNSRFGDESYAVRKSFTVFMLIFTGRCNE